MQHLIPFAFLFGESQLFEADGTFGPIAVPSAREK